mmetsp:Transcript_89151/g.248089  ORF Transcript_89151/g.248089 Transcript_89151/m.248089 type:complete len:101 (+) Transcript_89151:433-735(+)
MWETPLRKCWSMVTNVTDGGQNTTTNMPSQNAGGINMFKVTKQRSNLAVRGTKPAKRSNAAMAQLNGLRVDLHRRAKANIAHGTPRPQPVEALKSGDESL